MAAAAICWPARATERDSDCGYRGLQPSAPQRRKGVLILVMRPVNTAFMYMGERANPSVHSTLTSHLKGHLIHTNDLVNNRMKEKWGCWGGAKKRHILENKDATCPCQHIHYVYTTFFFFSISLGFSCSFYSFFTTTISCAYLCKSVISCSHSRSLTPSTSYSDSTLWFLWGSQTSPEASFYKPVYSSKWIREAGELFKTHWLGCCVEK